jgi:5-methyltetrahydrofolate--homocysteine methyltransferase
MTILDKLNLGNVLLSDGAWGTLQPNAGVPRYIDGKTIFQESPEMMASFIPELINAGANIIGGCCGTTPEHIKAMAKALGR